MVGWVAGICVWGDKERGEGQCLSCGLISENGDGFSSGKESRRSFLTPIVFEHFGIINPLCDSSVLVLKIGQLFHCFFQLRQATCPHKRHYLTLPKCTKAVSICTALKMKSTPQG